MKKRRVVITGMGAVTPAGNDVQALWKAARDGDSFGGKITRFDPSENESQIAAHVDDNLDPASYGFTSEEAKKWDRSTYYAMIAAMEAMNQATTKGLNPLRCGSCIGSAIGGVEVMEYAFKGIAKNLGEDEPAECYIELANTDLDPSILIGYSCANTGIAIARNWGFRGPVTSISTGCTAGVDAVGYCLDVIRRGDADLMVSGGTDAALTPLCLTAFDGISAISHRNDDPKNASRPFDKDRDGFLMSEGAGIVVLEEYEHAIKRGAKILAEVVGYGSNSNAYHMTSIPADGVDVGRSLVLALDDAGIKADDIDYINAHGSSTPQNDLAETVAYKNIFGDRAYKIPISSTKSVLGHPLGAASAIELIVCVKALEDSWVPPTASLTEPSPDCDLDYVPRTGRHAEMKYIISNASGFGGLHSAVIVKKGEAQ